MHAMPKVLLVGGRKHGEVLCALGNVEAVGQHG